MANSSLISALGVGALTIGTSAAIVSTSYVSLHEWMRNSAHLPYKYQRLPCSGRLFEKINWEVSKEDRKLENPVENIKLRSNGIDGCLSIWWERTGGKDIDWTGNWNVLWGLRDNSYGMIFMFSLNSQRHYKDFSLSIYVLKKESNQEEWKTKYKDFQAWSGRLSADSILKPGNNLEKKEKAWCFLPGVSSSQQDCPNNKWSDKLNWNFKTGTKTGFTSESVDKWTNSIDKLFTSDMKKIYQDISGYYELEQIQE